MSGGSSVQTCMEISDHLWLLVMEDLHRTWDVLVCDNPRRKGPAMDDMVGVLG